MNRNSFIDKWLALSRGQRRATVVLAVIVIVLAVIQAGISYNRAHKQNVAADYSVLEQEISLFRSQADSIPLGERKRSYVRNDRVVRDTMDNRLQNVPVQRTMESVPRIEE